MPQKAPITYNLPELNGLDDQNKNTYKPYADHCVTSDLAPMSRTHAEHFAQQPSMTGAVGVVANATVGDVEVGKWNGGAMKSEAGLVRKLAAGGIVSLLLLAGCGAAPVRHQSIRQRPTDRILLQQSPQSRRTVS
jgi:hypothetical protein